MKSKAKIIICALLASVTLLSACANDDVTPDVVSDTVDDIAVEETEAPTEAITEEEITEPVTEAPTEEITEEITEAPTEAITEEEVTEAETDAPYVPVVIDLPEAERLTSNYVSMLTGLPVSKELYYTRPVAVMVNNIKKSLPQWGLSEADIIYEALAEGGITRLMAYFSDITKVGVIGSVRSTREYFLDFAANHNAILVHAGGNTEAGGAYEQIAARKINNLDFVNGGLGSSFCYRDEERRANMGYEHSLMTTGEMISNAISYKNYSRTISTTFDSSFKFVDYYSNETNPMTGGNTANSVKVSYNSSHSPLYIYNSSGNTYTRYQYGDILHIDAATGEALEFTNILIIGMDVSYQNDSYEHIDVMTTGSGSGYYVSGGKYIPITWKKIAQDVPMVLYNSDGSVLKMNVGKTFVNVVNTSHLSKTVFE